MNTLNQEQIDLLKALPLPRPLSDREIQVMHRIASSWHNAEIAADLGISGKTVDTHRGNLLRAIAGRTNACIVRLAVRLGLSILPPPAGVVLPQRKR